MKAVVWFWFVLGAVSVTGEVFYAKRQQPATLECAVSGSPRNLVWRRKGELIISVDSRGLTRKGALPIAARSRVNQETKLVISDVKEDDAGTFACEADGTKHEHTLVVVSVSASPSDPETGSKATLQCQVHGLTSSSLQWERPDGTPYQQTGTVELESVAMSDSGDWSCIIDHNGETHKETLTLQVKKPTPTTAPSTTQRKNRHNPSCPTCGNTSKGFDKSDWRVWVAVGVGCLVVVLLMVFVIVMCKRIRRKKKKILKMKNGRMLKGSKPYCQCNRPTAAARPQQGRRNEKTSTFSVQPLLIE